MNVCMYVCMCVCMLLLLLPRYIHAVPDERSYPQNFTMLTLKCISFTSKRSANALVALNSSLHTQTELAMTNHSKQLIGDTLHDAIKSSRKMARAFYIAFGGEIDGSML